MLELPSWSRKSRVKPSSFFLGSGDSIISGFGSWTIGLLISMGWATGIGGWTGGESVVGGIANLAPGATNLAPPLLAPPLPRVI